jgi:hypothetical protein
VGPVWLVCCLPGRTPTDRFVRPVRPGGGYVGGLWHARRMPCDIPDARELVGQLDAVTVTELDRYAKLEVEGRTFGYLWEPTARIGLKQTIAEQTALVAERPDVFEVQFTAYGYGWVVVHLDGVERDELAELVFEAWRLSAPAAVREGRGERLPV